MLINPMCDMPWDIYLDYLADQGLDQLREIDVFSLVVGFISLPYHNHPISNYRYGWGYGAFQEGSGLSMFAEGTESFGNPFYSQYSQTMFGTGDSGQIESCVDIEGCGI